MPQSGQGGGSCPGATLSRTSGCIGHVYSVEAAASVADLVEDNASDGACACCAGAGEIVAITGECADPIGAMPTNPAEAGFGAKYLSGVARNFAAQPGAQKKNAFPACSTFAAARAGSTIIPQTGSRSLWGVSAS